MKVSHKWLQKYFDQPLPNAEDLDHALTFHAFEIEDIEAKNDDSIIDVKILANRAADCLSHRGVSKELSAILNIPLKGDPFRNDRKQYSQSKVLTVSIDDSKLCDRYIGAAIKGVKVAPSPEWLKNALEAVGSRSINNVVDATNYVMLDLGQPLHAFDAGKLGQKDDVWHIRVRSAKDGEKITTLSNEEKILTSENLLITDGTTDAPLGIAGVKGGNAAEVTEATTDIIIESAHFNYASVRKTAQKLRLPTDASKRFENNLSPETAGYAIDAVIKLILEIAGGTLEGVTEVYAGVEPLAPVSVSTEKINGVLGTSLSNDQIADALLRLDLPFTESAGVFTVSPPFVRVDITIPEDLIEEVGRIVGLTNIAAVPLPTTDSAIEINKRFYYAEKIRQRLIELGYDEVMTYAMGESGEVEIENPIASDKAFLRISLKDGISEALSLNAGNAALLGRDDSAIFEMGSVFPSNDSEIYEIGIGYYVSGKKAEVKIREQLDAAKAQLETVLGVTLETVVTGNVLTFSLTALLPQLPEAPAYDRAPEPLSNRYKPFSPYPFALRDIALWVPEAVFSVEVSEIIRTNAGAHLIRVDKFDEFKKDGRVSYAFHLVFQSSEKTLSETEINAAMDAVTAIVQSKGWEVR